MYFGRPHWISDVIAAIEARLVAAEVVKAERVFPFLGDPGELLNTPRSERFIAISPASMTVMADVVTGGGANDTPFDAMFDIELYARAEAGRTHTDRQAFQDRAESLSTLLKNVCTALQCATLHTTVDGQDVSVLTQPMRLVRVDFSQRRVPAGWVTCKSVWSAPFRADFGGV